MRRFLASRVGIALVVAIVIIGIAAVAKIESNVHTQDAALRQKVGLVVDTAVQTAIQNGDQSNLQGVLGTSTLSDKVAALEMSNSTATPEELTATDRFAREFFTQYIALKNSGATIDQNTGMNLVNQLLSQDYGSPTEEKTYTTADIKVLNTDSLMALKAYGNALGAILQAPLPPGYTSELTILAKASDSGDDSDLPKLALNVAHYQSVRDKILALPVPYALENAHVALINSISAILEGVRGMTYITTDPVGATKMIAQYQDGIEAISLPLEAIKQYLIKQDVSFSSSDSGYILVQ
ncbi:MAG: hypothetical protein KGI79_03080 [Patescibacteria group bacterium]|nr:hypothetical protein [Patescibacteria group bacterium]MDE2116833.1 hypothetical protein [Patescibacteria group bacterium]